MKKNEMTSNSIKFLKLLSVFVSIFSAIPQSELLANGVIIVNEDRGIANSICSPSMYSSKIFPVGIVVTGSVVDEKNKPIEGVTIYVKNSSFSAVTDKNGKFSIKVSTKKSILVFTMMNYTQVERTVGENSTINVRLKETSGTLNDVVVIGFGVQKKVNLTGAVASIDGASLIDAPVSNITNALIGNATGISGVQTSGEPGHNSTNIYIRGISTFNTAGASPLVVIDGIEQPAEQPMAQLDAMDANEIQSVSILKDAASTAVYGIRGANGVIVVTTKKGVKGKQSVSVATNFGTSAAANLLQTVNSYQYGIMNNEAINHQRNQLGDNSNNSLLFSDEELWKFKNNRDYTPEEVDAMLLTDAQKTKLKASPALWYGSEDFMKQELGGNGNQAQLNTNIRGGTDKVTYFTSLGYFYQGSIMGNTSFGGANTGSTYNRFNYRSNMDFHPVPNLDISISMAGQFGITSGSQANTSVTNDWSRYKAIWGSLEEALPFLAPAIMDGHLVSNWAGTAGTSTNPLGLKIGIAKNPLYPLLTSGQGIIYNTLLTNTIKIVHRMNYMIQGLTFRGSISYDDNFNKIITHNPSIPNYSVTRDAIDPNIFDYYGGVKYPDNLNVNAGSSGWNKTYIDMGFDYLKSFGKHRITALLLGKGSVYNMPSDTYHTPSGIMGLVGRITENYKQRYMGEIDLGYNGTEQFAADHRFGFFPAVSAGWLISSEKFFPQTKWIDYLKIKGSFGIVGSDNLGGRRYLYQPTAYLQGYSSNAYYPGISNGSAINTRNTGAGTVESFVGNPDVTWETAKKTNIGLESNLFNNRIVFGTDVFFDRRDHILTTLGNSPSTLGIAAANLPPANVGIVTNQGYEVSLAWNDNFKALSYSIKGNLSYTHNKIIYKAEAPNPYQWMNTTGFSIGQYYGLKSDGFFNTPQELATRPFNSFTNNIASLGDIRYKDINGDGVIDNQDVVPIGYANLPQYAYNFNFKFNYKGLEFSILLNGTLNGSYYLNSINYTGFLYKFEYDDRWTPEKAANGTKILYPRLQIGSTTGNFNVSDFWLKSNNFLKIKNMALGYTFSTQKLRKAGIGISSIRIYGNANNIFTFKNQLSKYGVDPETTDQSSGYIFPLTKSYVFGATVLF